MPVYEYYCSVCKSRFELLRPMDQMKATAPCMECDTPSWRVLSVFTVMGRSSEGFSVPMNEGGGGCACGGSCSCGA